MVSVNPFAFEWFDSPAKASLSLLTGEKPVVRREFGSLPNFERYISEVKARGVTVYWQTPHRATACGRP